MKFSEFLEKKALTGDDLCGAWEQRGVDLENGEGGASAAEKLSWMRVRVKRSIRAKEMKIPADAECKFMRGKVAFAKVGETMEVHVGSSLVAKIVCGGGQFTVGDASPALPVDEPKAKRRGKKGASEPLVEKKTWVNRALQDKLNAECYAASCAYWDAKGKAI